MRVLIGKFNKKNGSGAFIIVSSFAATAATALLLLLLLTSIGVVQADKGSAGSGQHPHRGVVKPFQSGDPKVKLDKSALQILRQGKPYKTQIQDGSSGRGLVVQDVDAPTNIVWDRILDFPKYPKMVPKTVETKIYKRTKLKHHQERIWVKMKIGFPILKLTFFINHLYDPNQHSMTWTLDYDLKSDLDDSCGYWYVIPHPDFPLTHTRVYYSVEVSMFNWVPQFVVDFMSKQALVDATTWVKKQSEIEYNKKPSSTSTTDVDAIQQQTDDPRKKKKRKGGLGGWVRAVFGGGGRSSQGGDDTIVVSNKDVEQQAVVVGSDGTATAAVATTTNNTIGATRYALVFTVLSLTLYSIHLYFSQ